MLNKYIVINRKYFSDKSHLSSEKLFMNCSIFFEVNIISIKYTSNIFIEHRYK